MVQHQLYIQNHTAKATSGWV